MGILFVVVSGLVFDSDNSIVSDVSLIKWTFIQRPGDDIKTRYSKWVDTYSSLIVTNVQRLMEDWCGKTSLVKRKHIYVYRCALKGYFVQFFHSEFFKYPIMWTSLHREMKQSFLVRSSGKFVINRGTDTRNLKNYQ